MRRDGTSSRTQQELNPPYLSTAFQIGDYINFAYINCKDYTGQGSYAQHNGISWNVMQGSLHVDGK